MNSNDRLIRLHAEENDLFAKIVKLQEFIGTASFKKLSKQAKRYLQKQLKYMAKYHLILCKRISLFRQENKFD